MAPKAVCYMLLSHAALSVIHRFTKDEARPVPFIYGESGSLKTSLCQVFLSYFGPRFTATDTAKMMLNAMFYTRQPVVYVTGGVLLPMGNARNCTKAREEVCQKKISVANVAHAPSFGLRSGQANPLIQ